MRFQDNLQVSGGKLTPGRGSAVHAASFLRQRLVILDCELLESASELKRIWLHELLHFVWWRLGNSRRFEWEALLLAERATGELGWSAEWRKDALTEHDRLMRTRKWREYCAESFCDTGAWVATSERQSHPEVTLPSKARQSRLQWWTETIRYNSKGSNALDSSSGSRT